jgi:hypothetical protein
MNRINLLLSAICLHNASIGYSTYQYISSPHHGDQAAAIPWPTNILHQHSIRFFLMPCCSFDDPQACTPAVSVCHGPVEDATVRQHRARLSRSSGTGPSSHRTRIATYYSSREKAILWPRCCCYPACSHHEMPAIL